MACAELLGVKKLPKIDFKQLEAELEQNRRARLEFVKLYANWLKRAPNKVWSRQHKKYFGKKPAK